MTRSFLSRIATLSVVILALQAGARTQVEVRAECAQGCKELDTWFLHNPQYPLFFCEWHARSKCYSGLSVLRTGWMYDDGVECKPRFGAATHTCYLHGKCKPECAVLAGEASFYSRIEDLDLHEKAGPLSDESTECTAVVPAE